MRTSTSSTGTTGRTPSTNSRSTARRRWPQARYDVAKLEKGADKGRDDGRVKALPRGGVEEGEALDGRGPRDHEPLHGRDLRSRTRGRPTVSACPSTSRRAKCSRSAGSSWRAQRPGQPGRRSTAGNLKTLRGIYIDCGSRRPVPHPVRLAHPLQAPGGGRHPAQYEEFDDNHSDVDYRMDVCLPFLYRALKP